MPGEAGGVGDLAQIGDGGNNGGDHQRGNQQFEQAHVGRTNLINTNRKPATFAEIARHQPQQQTNNQAINDLRTKTTQLHCVPSFTYFLFNERSIHRKIGTYKIDYPV